MAFSYTAREEMCSAVKKLSQAVNKGYLKAGDIDETMIERCLYTGFSPKPDLLVRTSGEVRLSDFLLWQSSYSVTYFSEVLWPDFSLFNLMAAIFYFQRHHRYIENLSSNQHTQTHHELRQEESLEKEAQIRAFLKTVDT